MALCCEMDYTCNFEPIKNGFEQFRVVYIPFDEVIVWIGLYRLQPLLSPA